MSDKKTTEKTIDHPLEKVFDIERGTTIVEREESLPLQLIQHEEYDNKDKELEDQLEEIRSAAMDAFDAQNDVVDTVEGKYVARNAEVAVQFLNTALMAVKEKSNIKIHKDKLVLDKINAGKPSTQNNTVNIFDRNELLRLMRDGEPKKEKNISPPIEGKTDETA